MRKHPMSAQLTFKKIPPIGPMGPTKDESRHNYEGAIYLGQATCGKGRRIEGAAIGFSQKRS